MKHKITLSITVEDPLDIGPAMFAFGKIIRDTGEAFGKKSTEQPLETYFAQHREVKMERSKRPVVFETSYSQLADDGSNLRGAETKDESEPIT